MLLAVFYPALNGPFLLDDTNGIVNNPEIRTPGQGNLWKIVKNHRDVRAVDHHPVSALSFMVDYQWSGLDPFGYHLSNLFYLWLVAGVVLLLYREVGRASGERDPLWPGVALSFVWAVHPLASMQVGYVMGRQESLLILFYLLALFCVMREWRAASIACGVASFLCKEVAVTLPGAILLVDWARGGRSLVATLRQHWKYYAGLTGIWLLLCVYHLRGARRGEIGTSGMPLAAPKDYFLAQCGVWVDYVTKLVWPAKLVFYPYVRAVESVWDWAPGLVGMVVYLGIAAWALSRNRWAGVMLLLPVLVLTVTSSVIPIPYEPAMEYRMFLPALPLLGLALTGWWRVARPAWLRVGLVVLVVLGLGARSHVRARDYETAMQLYEKDLAQDGRNLNSLDALSGVYREAKLNDRATAVAWRLVDLALEEKNKEFTARGFVWLGLLAYGSRNFAESKDFYQRAIEANGNWHARLNLATVHVELYELVEAERLLTEYLGHFPDSQPALLVLYESRMSAKKYDEAEEIFNRFMELYPERQDLDAQRTRILNLKRKQTGER